MTHRLQDLTDRLINAFDGDHERVARLLDRCHGTYADTCDLIQGYLDTHTDNGTPVDETPLVDPIYEALEQAEAAAEAGLGYMDSGAPVHDHTDRGDMERIVGVYMDVDPEDEIVGVVVRIQSENRPQAYAVELSCGRVDHMVHPVGCNCGRILSGNRRRPLRKSCRHMPEAALCLPFWDAHDALLRQGYDTHLLWTRIRNSTKTRAEAMEVVIEYAQPQARINYHNYAPVAA